MEDRILSFDEITSVDTLDELKEIYSKNGEDFPNDDDLVNRIRQDWAVEMARLNNKSKSGVQSIPKIEIVIDDTTYSTFGVIHPEIALFSYRSLEEEIKSRKCWFFEQNFKFTFGLKMKRLRGVSQLQNKPLVENIVEMADHKLRSYRNYHLKAFVYGAALGALLKFSPYLTLAYLVYFNYNSYRCAAKQKKEERELNLYKPLDAFSKDIPAYVKFELKKRNNQPYTQSELRSMYMAEFMKAWKLDEDKNLLCGVAHGPEVPYFLKHGTNSEIFDLANMHANMAQNDPEKYRWFLTRLKIKGGPSVLGSYLTGLVGTLAVLP